MKRTLLFMVGPLVLAVAAVAQNAKFVISGSTTRVVSSGSAEIVLNNADWLNNASFASFVPDTGTVRLTGGAPSSVGGSDSTKFYNLRVNKPGTQASLTSSTIHVTNQAELLDGNFYLGDNKLDLLGTGTLMGETYPSGLRFYCNDDENGRIRAVRTLSTGTNANIAGLGLDLNVTGTAPGSTLIIRGHDNQISTVSGADTSIGRYYDITPAVTSGYTYEFVFRYHQNEVPPVVESDFVFYRSPSYGVTTSDWQEWGKGNGPSSPGYPTVGLASHNPTTNVVSLTGINTFSRWTVSNSVLNPLPVELLSYQGECAGGAVLLRWTTASELNNDFFRVERSADLMNWQTVGTVKGAGNSNVQLSYSLTDSRPENGLTYYRLTQVDFNGDSETFDYIVVACQPQGIGLNDMTVYPNPADDRFTVKILSAAAVNSAKLEFTDMNGKRILERNISLAEGVNEFTFDRWNLNPGAYVIQLRAEELNLKPVKLVVK